MHFSPAPLPRRVFVAGLLLPALAFAAQAPSAGKAAREKARSYDEQYVPGPDSQAQPGVPVGATFQFKFDQSKIFPGTSRTITVYVPAQYKAQKPACVYVGFDSLAYNAPVVFDNLIHKGEVPVLIGIGISPGTVASARGGENPRFNRSSEFDALSPALARMVLEEIYPEVEKRQTPGGLPIRLSRDPNDACTGGGSTGAIAAFTAAWERPDAFRRVFSSIGTYVGMRGGDRYPVLVRKTEPKPIRIFQQDGAHDQWMGGPEVGDWWMSNQAMQRALEFAGYACEHVWGEGSHNPRHATSVFPDAQRWLWKGWPQPVTAGESSNHFLQEILEPGAKWERTEGTFSAGSRLATDPVGNVWVHDPVAHTLSKLFALEPQFSGTFSAIAFGPDGKLYAVDNARSEITSFSADGKKTTVATDIHGSDLVVTHDHRLYIADPGNGAHDGKLWLLADGKRQLLDSGLSSPHGLVLSPDGLWLAASESATHHGYSYRVADNGTLDAKQRLYSFHVPEAADDSGAQAWRYDRDGHLYAATRLGVQVMDRNGRSRAILPLPDNSEVTDLCFAGADFKTLYVLAQGKLWRRTLKPAGAPTWAKPIKLPPWGAG